MRAPIYAMGLLSGAAALTFQAVWVRRLSLILGSGTTATATVLAVFLGGLALGSCWLGRRASRVRRPLLLFGLLELCIAGSALLLPLGWRALEDAYPSLWQAFDGASLPLTATAAIATALLLGIPTMLMGGTLPVLARPATRVTASLPWDMGRLFATSTLGAVLGCAASSLVLLPELGLTQTGHCAVALTVVVGLAALALGWRAPAPAPAPAHAPAHAPAPGTGTRTEPRRVPTPSVVLLVAALSGACALGYEVLWTRVLAVFLHDSTYASPTVLVCFLAGLALGSVLLVRPIDRLAHPGLALAACQLGVALATLGAALLHPTLPTVAELLAQQLVIDAWWKALVLQSLLTAGIVLPAAFCMGLSFPLAVRLLARGPGVGVSCEVGHLLAASTAGAIVGLLVTAFLLVPGLGLAGSFRWLLSLNLAVALFVVLACPGQRAALRRAVAAFFLLALAGAQTVLPDDQFSRTFSRGRQLVYYADGISDTVMVLTHPEAPDVHVLAFGDGRGRAGSDTNASDRFLGHLPMLLHGKARQVLSLCLGAGNTLAALVLHPTVEHIDAVEPSVDALEAIRWFPTNQGAWQHAAVDVHVADGRQWLLATDRSYDVIQLVPPEIYTAGVVQLYTREFYALARSRLRPGGLLCHWANVRLMSLDAQRMLVATFLDVFPHGTLWMPLQSPGCLLLVAGTQPLTIDYPALQERCTTGPVGDDLRQVVGIAAATDLLASFKLGPQGAQGFCGEAPVLSDDRTLVDFLVPRSRDADFGLLNTSAALRFEISSMLPDHREYVAEKLATLAAHVETAFPLLRGFPDRALRYAVRTRLEWRAELWLEAFETLVAQIRAGEVSVEHY